MPVSEEQTRALFDQLQNGDRVELRHEVKVGLKIWHTTVTGAVVGKERRRQGLHYRRNGDDKVYSDLLILRRDDGEITSCTIDEFSELKRLSTAGK